jgi:hypothetical protein
MITALLKGIISTSAVCFALALTAAPALAQRAQPRIAADQPDPRPIDATSALPLVGELLPPFEARFLSGAKVTADSLVGSPYVIAIWSTDCPGSRSALRAMHHLFDTLNDRGVRFLVLATDTNRVALETFLADQNVRLPVAQISLEQLRGFERSRRVTEDAPYRIIFSKPSFLVSDAETIIVARQGGYLPPEFMAEVQSFFGETSS